MINSFNFYRKLTPEALERNYTGFILSFLGLCCIILLTISEVYTKLLAGDRWTTELKTIQISENRMTADIRINFHHMACDHLEVMGLQGKGMFITPIDTKELVFLKPGDENYYNEKEEDGAGDGTGCLVEGFINVPRLSGSFWFAPRYANLLELPDDTKIQANMTHTIHQLTFESEEYYAEVLKNIDGKTSDKVIAEIERQLDLNGENGLDSTNFHFPTFPDEDEVTVSYLKSHYFALRDEVMKQDEHMPLPPRQVFFTNLVYDLTLIPVVRQVSPSVQVVMYDYTMAHNLNRYTLENMKSSIGYHFHKASLDKVPLHAAVFHWQISPISIEKRPEKVDLFTFFIELLGAIAGIYVVCLLLDWLINILKDCCGLRRVYKIVS